MRILLISANTATDPYAVYPLGLAIIAGALRRHGHQVAVFDLLQSGGSLEAFRRQLLAIDPELIGISIRNIDNTNAAHEQRYLDVVEQLVEVAHRASTAPIVLGGAGYSIMPEAILARVGADYGIVGEGEELVCELAATIAAGKRPRRQIWSAGARLVDRQLPAPDYDAALLQQYLECEAITPVQTKRGCNRRCAYCTYPALEGRKLRPRPPAAVVDDLELLAGTHGIRQIFFVDSVFNDTRGHYRQLVAEMRRRRFNTPWIAFFSPTRELDDDIVAQMRETGLESAEIGMDAATDETLRGLHKGFRFRDVVTVNDLFVRHGVVTAHSCMFGGPNETPATVDRGIANLVGLQNTSTFVFLGIRILPQTPLWKRAVREGVIATDADLLEPVYYFSPATPRDWLEQRLTNGFAGHRHCVFPPDAINRQLQLLHRIRRRSQ